MRLNVIAGHRPSRIPLLLKELEVQGISDYELWPSQYRSTIKESINAAHKQIVEYAMVAEWERVCIAEDDVCFTHPQSWQYFLSKEPEDYDLYLGGIYLGDILPDNSVKEFTGFHLYMVHCRFYEAFMNLPNDEHIDRALDGLGRYVVCNPFAAIQHNGWSSNTGKEETYDNLLENRQLYNGH